ncbi:MAG: DUF4215 domain-containing protein [Nannocystaceae bacterium]
MRFRPSSFALPVAASLLLIACGDDMAVGSETASESESGGETTTSSTSETTAASQSGTMTAGTCTPGQVQECTCPAGTGTQTCQDDGSGYGACQCVDPVCGNGMVEGGEECDAGAENSDFGACLLDCTAASCGDGYVQEGVEACDDGVNDGSYGGCMPGCAQLGPHCGDGVVGGAEACDDGNEVDGDGCNVTCLESGHEIWTDLYPGRDTGDAVAHGVAVDHDGSIVVVGEQFVVGENANIWIAKYSSEGDVLWTRTVIGEGGGTDIARGVAVDSEGSYVITGELAVKGEGGNLWLAKLDPGGTEVWSLTYNGPADLGDVGNAVAVDSMDNIWVVGSEYHLIGLDDIVVQKRDPSGALVWAKTLDNKAGNDRAWGVAVASDDSGYVVGSVYEPIGLADLWVRRYTASGTDIFTKTWDQAAGNDVARAVAVDGDDNLVFTGEVYVPNGLANIVTRKLTDTGVEVWTQIYDSAGSDNDIGHGIAVAPDGTLVVAGEEYTANDFAACWVRKMSPAAGDELWTHIYDGPAAGNDVARAVAIASNGDIYAVGQSYEVGTFASLWVRKLTP